MNIISQKSNDGLHYSTFIEQLDKNKDGIVDKNEIINAVLSLEKKANEAKKSGDDALYEVYKRQIDNFTS